MSFKHKNDHEFGVFAASALHFITRQITVIRHKLRNPLVAYENHSWPIHI